MAPASSNRRACCFMFQSRVSSPYFRPCALLHAISSATTSASGVPGAAGGGGGGGRIEQASAGLANAIAAAPINMKR